MTYKAETVFTLFIHFEWVRVRNSSQNNFLVKDKRDSFDLAFARGYWLDVFVGFTIKVWYMNSNLF